MSDLISRSALKDFIVSAVDKQKGRGIDLLKVSEVIDVIDNQPTAYNVEKVVEEIKKFFGNMIDDCVAESVPFEILDCSADVCKIVKMGGLEHEQSKT